MRAPRAPICCCRFTPMRCPTERMRGASVFTLSEQASDREAAALAARENQADLVAGIDLSRPRARK